VTNTKGSRQLAFVISVVALASYKPLSAQLKPLDPKLAVTDYTFAVKTGTEVRVHVKLDATSKIIGTSISHNGEQVPFQEFSPCSQAPMQLYEGDEDLELVAHADYNFDGFEDLKILQDFNPHLAKSLFCIYLWDDRAGRFREQPLLSQIGNPWPDPKNKTISAHEDYVGGSYRDSTYVWRGTKLVMISESGVVSGSENPDCGFTFYCSRLVNGRTRQLIDKPIACGNQPDERLECPESVPLPSSPKRKSKPIK
jgi:hypothetical protein